MLMSMNDKLTVTNRELKQSQHEIEILHTNIKETNLKLDREAKIKDQVDALRQNIQTLEKGMALDIENAVKNHDEIVFQVGKITEKVSEIGKERATFMLMQDKIRGQIASFENFINEGRGVHDQQMIDFKRDVTKRMDDFAREITDFSVDKRQLRSMIKNQNFHFTEIQTEIGLLRTRMNAVERTCSEVPGLIEYTETTDIYLQNYLPTEVYAEIHRALFLSFENAPTKMRLAQLEYAKTRTNEALAKIAQIGTLTQETFAKNVFNPLRLDFDYYAVKTLFEDEEKERQEAAEREAEAAKNRKTETQIFRENLFAKNIQTDLAIAMENKMRSSMKKLVNKQIDQNAWMKKLIEFYEEEMGSDSDQSDRRGDASSIESLSSAEEEQQSPKRTRTKKAVVVKQLSSEGSAVQVPQSKGSGASSRSKSEGRKNLSDGKLSDQEEEQKEEQKPPSKASIEAAKIKKKQESSQEKSKDASGSVESLQSSEKSASQASEESNKEGSSAQEVEPMDMKALKGKAAIIDSADSLNSNQKMVQSAAHESETASAYEFSQHANTVDQSDKNQIGDNSFEIDLTHDRRRPGRSKSTRRAVKVLDSRNDVHQNDEDSISAESSIIEKKPIKNKTDKKKKAKREDSEDQDSQKKEKKLRGTKKIAAELEQTLKKINTLKQNQMGVLSDLSELKDKEKQQASIQAAVQETIDKKLEAAEKAKQEKLAQQRAEAKRNKQKSQERRRAAKASGSKKTQEKKKNQKPDPALDIYRQDAADIMGSSYEDSKERSKGGRRRNGGERPGAKAAKEAMEEVQRKLEQCVMRDEFEKVNEELQRAISSVTVFRTQLKIYEKKFRSEKQYDDSLSQTKDVMQSIEKSFEPLSQTNSSVESKMVQSAQAASNTKKVLVSNINRVDLLTDAKIGDMKGLMKEMADQIIQLSKRLTIAEGESLKRDYDNVPADIMAITKTELQLKHNLANMIEEARETKDWLGKEFKRLRREHYGNLQDIRQILVSFDQMSGRVQNVMDRQGLNDQAMASIFKVMKLDYALDAQDEVDREGLNLMGLTNTEHPIDQKLKEMQKEVDAEIDMLNQNSLSPRSTLKQELNPKIVSKDRAQTMLSGQQRSTCDRIKKLRASTKIPIEHKIKLEGQNQPRPVKVISLDANCQTHADGTTNEIVMKAFKMACLQYKPSPVKFEQCSYTRKELINAKNTLLKYCLTQLRHLDLGVLEQKRAQTASTLVASENHLNTAWAQINVNQDKEDIDYADIDPKNIPTWPQTRNGSQHNNSLAIQQQLTQSSYKDGHKGLDWMDQDSIASLKQASAPQEQRFANSNTKRSNQGLRMSLPVGKNRTAITQRGVGGKQSDSQQYSNLKAMSNRGGGQRQSTRGGASSSLRQAISLNKVERLQFDSQMNYPINNAANLKGDSLNQIDNEGLFSSLEDGQGVVGRNCMATIQNYTLTSPMATMMHQQPPVTTMGISLDVKAHRGTVNRTGLFSPLAAGQKMPIPTPICTSNTQPSRQQYFIGQRLNIRTQGGEKPSKTSDPHSSNYNNTHEAQSTVFSSLQTGGNFQSVFQSQQQQQQQSHQYQNTQNTPGGNVAQNRIKLPSLQQQQESSIASHGNDYGNAGVVTTGGYLGGGANGTGNKEKVKVDIPKGAINGLLIEGSLHDYDHEMNEQNGDGNNRQSQGSYLQQISGHITPLKAIDNKQLDTEIDQIDN